MHIKGVAMPSKDDFPIVILREDDGLGELTVTVGAAEAGTILLRLEGVSTPRPLTHELMSSIFAEQGLTLYRVELYGPSGAGDDACLARIEYGRGFRTWVRDVRPSDALALAATVGAPVYAHRALLERPGERWYEEVRRA